MSEKTPDSEKSTGVKRYFEVGEVFGYFFRKKDPNRPVNFNLKMMHGINKISIIMFLIAIVFFLSKKFLF